MKPVIIIPAYNPDEKLINLVRDLMYYENKIVIINDGSHPKYNYIFKTIENECFCDIRYHEKNMGKGAALKTGIHYVMKKYPETSGCITADADGQHTPEDIMKISTALENTSFSLILGTRAWSGKDIPFKSKWGNKITSLVFFLSTGKKCQDTQTGLRGIPASLFEKCLNIPGNKYEYEMNMLMDFAKNNISFYGIRIETVYIDDNSSSHFNPIKDSLRIYFGIIKYSISSFTSMLIDLTAFSILTQLVFGHLSYGILLATIIARLISGNANFLMNKHWVFKSGSKGPKEAIKYFSLFFTQMIVSGLFVTAFGLIIPLPPTLIKIAVDTGLFFISYNIQKKYIFKFKKIRSVSYR